MKLGKLLAAGKSVMDSKKEVSYRASKQVYLPKFGSAANPFKAGTEQPAVDARPKETGDSSAVPRAAHVAVAESPAARAAAQPSSVTVTSRAPVFAPVYEKKNASWSSKLNPVSILRVVSSKGKANSPNSGQRPTQTELSLDSVKVVHNDLTDVEVEIVPIKSRSSPADLPPPKKSWEFLGERLFGVEAT